MDVINVENDKFFIKSRVGQTNRAFSPRKQDRFDSTKKLKRLTDYRVGGQEFIRQILTWQCSLQASYWKNKIRKLAELCMGPPY